MMSRCDFKDIGKDLFHRGASDAEFARTNRSLSVGTCTIRTLPDEVLLDIFDFYRQGVMDSWAGNWKWCTLVHVCRRWRHIVLTSSRRLDLRLLCTAGTSVRNYLDFWPPTLPIAIRYYHSPFSPPHPEDVQNIFIALEKPDRVCSIELCVPNSLLEKVLRVMQVPFLALKSLYLRSTSLLATVPIVSQSFLGGSAPGLQKLFLGGSPFSASPAFLLSYRDLVDLQLSYIPNPDEILPEVIVTSLSNLSQLKILSIGFICTFTLTLRHSRNSHIPRLTLSALSEFTFSGNDEYLEDLLARIDTPFIQRIQINFHYGLSDVPQLCRLICRTEGLRSPNQATIIKYDRDVSLIFRQVGRWTESTVVRYPRITIKNCSISLLIRHWQLSSAAQFCLQLTPIFSGINRLTVESPAERPFRLQQEVVGPADWLDLFRSFSAVDELYVSRRLGSPVAFALAGATEQADILPALRSLCFEDAEEFASVEETINPFSSARRLSHCHVSAFSDDQF